MIPMKCVKALTYAGRKLQPGDPFEARGKKDARVLIAIGKAQRVTVIAPVIAQNPRKQVALVPAASAPLVAPQPVTASAEVAPLIDVEVLPEGATEVSVEVEDEVAVEPAGDEVDSKSEAEVSQVTAPKVQARRRNHAATKKQ